MKSSLLSIVSVMLLLTACASPDKGYPMLEQHMAERNWMRAVIEARRQLEFHESDVELRSTVAKLELKAAEYYYHKGQEQLEIGDIRAALAEFQQGLLAKPKYQKLNQAMESAMLRQKANNFYQEAVANWLVGRETDTYNFLEQALAIDPANPDARSFLLKIKNQEAAKSLSVLSPYSSELISIDFKNTDFKGAFEFIAESFDLNLVYDSELEIRPVTVKAEQVSVIEALDLMVAATHTFYTQTGPNTIIIADDSLQKRREYEEYYIRNFNLKVADATQMAEMLSGVLPLENISVNKNMNSIVIRDKQSIIMLAEQIIVANDRKPAELVLEVEILEVNREKTEQLGFDFGSEVSVDFPQFSSSTSWADALKLGKVMLPSMAFRYFKKDMDAKILANPKIRVMDRKQASLHVGDRIPLLSSFTVEATGQTRTAYTYQDIGIKMNVVPSIHLDNSATVKLDLEISSLGQNMGTASDPAWSVSTRNSQTQMMLRDGETAILAGLIKEEDRDAHVKVPGLGDIPAIGTLFTNINDGNGRTDVLLTITPRIVRNWDISDNQADKTLYSGSKDNYSIRPKYASRRSPLIPVAPEVLPIKDPLLFPTAPQQRPALSRPQTFDGMEEVDDKVKVPVEASSS